MTTATVQPVRLLPSPSDAHANRYTLADRERAYQLWRSVANRSYRKVADTLGIAVSTISQWAQRDGWIARADRDDRADAESVQSYVAALFDAEIEKNVETIKALRDDAATPPKVRLESAIFMLGVSRISPLKQSLHAADPQPATPASGILPTAAGSTTEELRRRLAAKLGISDEPATDAASA